MPVKVAKAIKPKNTKESTSEEENMEVIVIYMIRLTG